MQLQKIQAKIFEIRDQRVMLNFDSAELCEVETSVSSHADKRNIKRFTDDFMFQLTLQDWEILKSQFVTSKQEKQGGTQKYPFAFTEQRLALLSGVLNSDKAINLNMGVMRAFFCFMSICFNQSEFNT